jgi:hypothetical protein
MQGPSSKTYGPCGCTENICSLWPKGSLPSGLILTCATWPLLEWIPLLHNIPNCYNMKNHVNSPDGSWKLIKDWHKMFSFLGYENWQIIKFFCAHKHKTLTILSLTAENVSSTLCSRILGNPVARECRIFHNLEIFFITHDALWVANELIYKNPGDIASYFSLVYLYLAANICPSL